MAPVTYRDKENRAEVPGISRRDFLKLAGSASAGMGLTLIPGAFWFTDAVAAIPAAGGYLLVDPKKCAGCLSCMLACSLVHEGREELSLSRIQILQDPFGHFPTDVAPTQCRQCVEPPCVEACPTGALQADSAHGNVRTVDAEKCNGCRKCLSACAFTPARIEWNPSTRRAQKCDLCSRAPFWKEAGGPGGKQACIEVCPMRAIHFAAAVSEQSDQGYNVNLRNENWQKLGFPVD